MKRNKIILAMVITISILSGLPSGYLNAQINPSNNLLNNKTSLFSFDQPFASYWFPLEILNWSPSTDPDAPYNRSGVSLKNKYVDSITVVNTNARYNEARVNPLSAFAPTSDNPDIKSGSENNY
jgi:endo-beta-N-acetylglucosaminidase D